MYELYVDVKREVIERYLISVEADDPDEAKDIAYEYFQDYPTGNDFIKTKLRDREVTASSTVLDVSFKKNEGINENVTDGVFGGDDCA